MQDDGVLKLCMAVDDEYIVPLKYWRMEIWSKDNDLLKFVEGKDLPATVNLAALDSQIQDNDINAVLVVQDVLGADIKTNINDLFMIAAANKAAEENLVEEPVQKSGWLEEF